MKRIIILLSLFVMIINAEAPQKRPTMVTGGGYSNYPQKSKHPIRTIMIQIRNGQRLPPGLMLKGPVGMPQRLRPMNLLPNYMFKTHPHHKRPSQPYLPPKQFQSSPPGPNTGEYVYENPFKNQNLIKPTPNLSQNYHSQIDHITHENSGPIHTIPAPNLSTNNGKFQSNDFTIPHDNHLSLTDSQNIFTSSLRPFHIHQSYEVTEEPTNDQTLHDPFSGQQKYFAPDPDPRLPSAKIQYALDSFSKPSNNNPLPIDVAASASLAQQLYQIVDTVPQQQLPDTYGLPLNNQPQLQQHMLQQASFVQGMPLSVYNPTYLVQQSNNLFNQHMLQQQQPVILKPDTNYGGSSLFNSPQLLETNNYQNQIGSVASPGQIYAASQDQLSQLQDDYALQGSASQNIQNIVAQQLIDSNPKQKQYQTITSETLSADEFSNLLKLEKKHQQSAQITDSTNNHNQYTQADNQFASNFYDFSPRQNENQRILTQANHDLIQKQYNNNKQEQQEELSAHQQHQQYLQQQFGNSAEPMRIFVPDDEKQDINREGQFNERSDTYYSTESSEETKDDRLNFDDRQQSQYSTEINSSEYVTQS